MKIINFNAKPAIRLSNELIVKFRFDIGDKAYFVRNEGKLSYLPCDACGSTGGVVLKDGKEYICPVCKGMKKIIGEDRSKSHYKVISAEVIDIDCNYYADEDENGPAAIRYSLEDSGTFADESLFISEEEAEEAIRKQSEWQLN